jgi:hypothetical protein
MMVTAVHYGRDRLGIGTVDMPVSDLCNRRRIAAPHAGCADDTHVGTEPARQEFQERITARTGTRQAVADANRYGRRRYFSIENDVEMGVEGRNFKHLGHGQPHFGRERLQVLGTEATIPVLDEVKVLDEKVWRTRAVPEQCRDLTLCRRVELAPFIKARRTPPP